MRCEKCGLETNRLCISMFNRDGSDSDYLPLIEAVDAPADEEGGCDVVIIETTRNWTGYELSAEEMMEDIRCPRCGEFPFKHKEVQVYEVVRIVCFKDETVRNDNTKLAKSIADQADLALWDMPPLGGFHDV